MGATESRRSRAVGPLPDEGGEAMTVYEAITIMISFGMFVVAMLSFDKKK